MKTGDFQERGHGKRHCAAFKWMPAFTWSFGLLQMVCTIHTWLSNEVSLRVLA